MADNSPNTAPHRTYTPAEADEARLAATHQDWVRAVRERDDASGRRGRGVRNKRAGY